MATKEILLPLIIMIIVIIIIMIIVNTQNKLYRIQFFSPPNDLFTA